MLLCKYSFPSDLRKASSSQQLRVPQQPGLLQPATAHSCPSACTPPALGAALVELTPNLDPFKKLEALMPSKAQFYTPQPPYLKADVYFLFVRAKQSPFATKWEVKFRCCGNKGLQKMDRNVMMGPTRKS